MIKIDDSIRIYAPIRVAFDLSRSIEVYLLGNIQNGQQTVTVRTGRGRVRGLVGLGQQVTWRSLHFGMQHDITTQITHFVPPRSFRETMIEGPFRSMVHDHTFLAQAGGFTELQNTIRFAAPLPPLGLIAERSVLREYMKKLLSERLLVIKQVAESGQWAKYVL